LVFTPAALGLNSCADEFLRLLASENNCSATYLGDNGKKGPKSLPRSGNMRANQIGYVSIPGWPSQAVSKDDVSVQWCHFHFPLHAVQASFDALFPNAVEMSPELISAAITNQAA
jgi:hypothetical protein